MTRVAQFPLTARTVAEVLAPYRFRWAREDDLQRAIAGALAGAGLPLEREVALTRRDRVDLLVGRVAVEVKIAGSARGVRRQLARYAGSPLVDEIVLVTARSAHTALAGVVGGKPVEVVSLAGAGL